MYHKRMILLFSFAFCFAIPANADHDVIDDHPEIIKEISAKLKKLTKNNTLDAISVGVVDSSGLIWHKSYGYAIREKRIPATKFTVYRAGSLSKLLTASAILQMEEQSIIDIDQVVSAYLPRFTYRTRFSESGEITPRHLLTHLSGLPSNINKGHWTEERFSLLVERLRTEYAAYPTDFILNYSNVGYSLLGTIIEENTDYLFEDYIQKHLFDPLGMHQSNFHPYGNTSPMAAVGYKNQQAQENLPIRDIPALGLNTSISDMSKFIAAILNSGTYKKDSILKSHSIDSMFTIQNNHVELDFDQNIGLPWFINSSSNSAEPVFAEHGGTTINFSSQITISPEHHLGVIILSNTSRVNNTIKNIANELLSELIDNKKLQLTQYVPKINKNQENDYHTGKHRYLAKSGIIELDTEASQLCDCQTNRMLNLVPLPDGWFGISPDNQKLTSKITEQVIDGNEVIVLEHQGKKQRIGSRYKQNNNLFNWEQHYGDYDIVNPDSEFPVTDVRIYDQENMTYMCYRMPKLSDKLIVLPITPVSEHEAITEGLGRSKGETVYSQMIDGKKHLIYSGFIARKRQSDQQ